jgi:hypothetical protein
MRSGIHRPPGATGRLLGLSSRPKRVLRMVGELRWGTQTAERPMRNLCDPDGVASEEWTALSGTGVVSLANGRVTGMRRR